MSTVHDVETIELNQNEHEVVALITEVYERHTGTHSLDKALPPKKNIEYKTYMVTGFIIAFFIFWFRSSDIVTALRELIIFFLVLVAAFFYLVFKKKDSELLAMNDQDEISPDDLRELAKNATMNSWLRVALINNVTLTYKLIYERRYMIAIIFSDNATNASLFNWSEL
jgi:hypothetical protein